MKRLLLLMLLLVTVFQGFSQTNGISYQAVILSPNAQQKPGANGQGNVLANSAVTLQFTVVNSSGTTEYEEQQSTSTDKYGMINLLIGTGMSTSGNVFSDIFWDGLTKKLKVGIDFSGGSNFSPLSEQDLTYIPQPPTNEVSNEIASNSAAITAEADRAGLAETANSGAILALQGEQTTQNTAIALNTEKVSYPGDQDISGILTNSGAISTIQGGQTTQNITIALNTAKTGITSKQASDIATNNTKVSDINHVALSTTTDLAEGTNLYYTEARVSANTNVAANTLKTGITTVQATTISNTTGINTGDNAVNSNYSSLVTNATHTGDVTGATALTITNDAVTTNKILNGNVTDAKIAAVAASKLTGTVSIASGGTNITTYTQGDILYASSATQLTVLAKGTENQVLTMNAGATAPEWVTPTSAGATHEIGDTYAGGIIFYLDPSGLHGLIAAPKSQETTATWMNGSSIDTRAYGSGLFEGKYNTKIINKSQGGSNSGSTSAAAICAAYEGGTGGWYLPSIEELNLIYENIGPGSNALLIDISGFNATRSYWSSTEYNIGKAWYMDFYYGDQDLGIKFQPASVRAVRAF